MCAIYSNKQHTNHVHIRYIRISNNIQITYLLRYIRISNIQIYTSVLQYVAVCCSVLQSKRAICKSTNLSSTGNSLYVIWMYIRVCLRVCVRVCACMCACMCVCVRVCTCMCVWALVCVCVYVCVRVCTCVLVSVHVWAWEKEFVCMRVCAWEMRCLVSLRSVSPTQSTSHNENPRWSFEASRREFVTECARPILSFAKKREIQGQYFVGSLYCQVSFGNEPCFPGLFCKRDLNV